MVQNKGMIIFVVISVGAIALLIPLAFLYRWLSFGMTEEGD